MEKGFKRYKIGDRNFYQTKMVMGQLRDLVDLLTDIALPNLIALQENPLGIVPLIGDKLTLLQAIVLREDGQTLMDKSNLLLADYLEENLDVEMGVQIILDFFDLTPIPSLLMMIQNKLKQVGVKVPESVSENLAKLQVNG